MSVCVCAHAHACMHAYMHAVSDMYTERILWTNPSAVNRPRNAYGLVAGPRPVC